MGDLLRFEQYSGRLIESLVESAYEKVDAAIRYSAPTKIEMRCGLDVPVIGDPTGVLGIACNQTTDFICTHCGPICASCREEYSCCGPTGKHVEDNDDGA